MAHKHESASVSLGFPPALSSIGIIELLDHDPRPTFILDLENPLSSTHHRLRTAFRNASLLRHPSVSSLGLTGANGPMPPGAQEVEFKDWAVASSHSVLLYHGILWTCTTLRNRWRIISGSPNAMPTSATTKRDHTVTVVSVEPNAV